MARTKSRGTLVDHLVAAIVPALIMLMVGGLMFFLLDLWYEGPFLNRLRWILFWFVFGIVLITRVGMQYGGELAKGYGVVLGGAVALVATRLSGFQPFLLVVMGFVWWATHKLTYDCTLLDEDQDAGVGLLQESGLDASTTTTSAAFEQDDPEGVADPLRPKTSWWNVWGGSRDAGRPHPPGTWLIYFAVASLPIFGLGQWFSQGVVEDRRDWLFAYVLAYIVGAMGLLLTTSFLNLRRYLRRRRLTMPAAMTTAWLSTGAVLIIGLVVVSAVLLPSLAGVKAITGSVASPGDRRASHWAMLKDGGVRDEGAPGSRDPESPADRSERESATSDGTGESDDSNAPQKGQGQGQEGGGRGEGRAKSGNSRSKDSSSKGGTSGKSGKRQNESGREKGQTPSQAKRQAAAEQDDASGSQASDDSRRQESDRGSTSRSQPSTPPFQAPAWLRVPILIVGAAFLIYGAFRYGPGLFQGLVAFLAALFGGLWFGGPKKRSKNDDHNPTEPLAAPPRPFASFANPFDVGLDRRLSPDDLILYSFEALEAWAFEQGAGRALHETPTEFVRRLSKVRPVLSEDAARLVSFFVAMTYGRRGFNTEALPPLRSFWRTLESGGASARAEQAVSV